MTQKSASLTILLGALCMSFAALFIRLIESADGFQILFYRGFAQCAVVLFIACLRRNITPITFFKTIDRVDVFLGVAMCSAFSFYVFALLNTSVASALFILSIAPVVAAILAWMVINERPTTRTWVAIVLSLLGVGIMVGGGLSDGRLLGNVFAIISACSFALMLVTARKSRKPDVLTGNFLGAGFAVILMGILAVTIGKGLSISTLDLWLSLGLGAFTIGLGIAFVAWGAPWLPAANVGVLVLLESVLSPVWVWIILGIAMQSQEVLGGTIVLSAVLLLATGMRRKRVMA